MILTQFEPQTIYAIATILSGTAAICVGVAMVRIKRSRRAKTDVAEAIYLVSQNIAELQHAVSVIAKQIDNQHMWSGKQQKMKRPATKVDRAIALSELGVSASNIQQETGLPKIDVSAIIRFHTASRSDQSPNRATHDKAVSIQ
ncbi:hypothetical protein [Nereida sp.]|uniref:hypothetical protein n=1 Tax=Nereida sp. TaxID=2736090 RepID=UPI003F69ED81